MQHDTYVCERRGLSGLVRKQDELAAPAPGEVQVAVKAIGLNFADVFSVLGLYAAAPKRPFVPGLEFAGEIVAIGTDVRNVAIGDRVMGVRFFGAYATALNVDARFVRKLPADWSFEEGAAHLVASLTAYYGLIDQCRLKRGERVLIESAAGGVGLAALKIAKAYGCFVIGAVGSVAKESFCLGHGYDAVVVRGHDFKAAVQRALGERPLDVIMEAIGGRAFSESYELLAPRGRIAVYGFAQFMPRNLFSYLRGLWQYLRRPKIDPLYLNNRSVSGFNLVYLFDHADTIGPYVDEIERLNMGKPFIGATYGFDDLPKALEALKSGSTMGKIVVRM